MESYFPTILMLLCVAVFLFLGYRNKTTHNILTSLKQKPKPVDVVLILLLSLIMICSFMILQFASIDIFALIGVSANGSSVTIDSAEVYIYYVLMAAIFPAVVEELVFRGAVLQGLRPYGKVWAIIASALLFSLYHMNAGQTIYQFIMGIVFASIVVMSGSLILSMLLHFFNNFAIITYTLISGSDVMLYSWNATTVISGIILAVVGAAIIWQMLKLFKKKDASGNYFCDSWRPWQKNVVNTTHLGYFICAAVAGVLWTIVLI